MKPWIVVPVIFGSFVGSGLYVNSGHGGSGRCFVITDGSRQVFEHERAHCAGWWHPSFEPADPPYEFRVKPYTGKLLLTECGPRFKCKSVQKACFALWKRKGVDVSASEGTEGYRLFNGCSYSE